MILDTTSKVLRIVLGEAHTTTACDITTAWAEEAVPNKFTPGNTNSHSNGVTPVTVVAAPSSAGFCRDVREVRLFNADTVTHTVTLQLFDGSTAWAVAPAKVSVPANGAFVYTPQSGITVSTVSLPDNTAVIPLTSVQLLALNGSPVTVVAAQVGKIIAVEWSCVTLDYNSTTYIDPGTDTGLYYQNSAGAAIDDTLYLGLTAAVSEVKYSTPAVLAAQSGLVGQPVVLTGSSDMTTGNSTASLAVRYAVITP